MKVNSQFPLLTLGLLGVVAAIGGYRLLNQAPKPPVQPSPATGPQLQVNQAKDLPAPTETAAKAQPTHTSASMAARGASLAEIADKAAFQAALLAFQRDLSAENWRAAMDSLLPMLESGKISDTAWKAFMVALGPFGKEALLHRFRPDDPVSEIEHSSARYAVLGWANVDANAAANCLASLPDGRYRDSLCWGLFQAMGGGQAAENLEELFHLLPESLWPSVALAQAQQQKSPEQVKNWLQAVASRVGEESPRYRAARQAASLLELQWAMEQAPKDVKPLAAFVERHFADAKSTTDRVRSSSLAGLTQHSPQAAVTVIERHFQETPTLLNNLPTLLEAWTKDDLAAPADWLNAAKGSPVYDAVTAAYVNVLRTADFKAAKTWAESIQAPELREATLRLIPPLPPL